MRRRLAVAAYWLCIVLVPVAMAVALHLRVPIVFVYASGFAVGGLGVLLFRILNPKTAQTRVPD